MKYIVKIRIKNKEDKTLYIESKKELFDYKDFKEIIVSKYLKELSYNDFDIWDWNETFGTWRL